MMDLESFAVYGSVARGQASKNSDVDILLISEELDGSLASRMERLYYECNRLSVAQIPYFAA